MRGVEERAVIAIVEGLESPYTSLFDFACRVNLKDCNKRVSKAALGGGFDSRLHRAQFFALDRKDRPDRVGRSLRRGDPSSAVRRRSPCLGATTAPWTSRAADPRMRNVGFHGPAQQGARHRGRLHLWHLGQIPSRTRPFVRESGLSRLDNLEQEKGKLLTFGASFLRANTALASREGLGASSRLRTTKAPTSSGALARITKFKEFMVEGWMVMVTTQVKEQGFGREGLEPNSNPSSSYPKPAKSASAGCASRFN